MLHPINPFNTNRSMCHFHCGSNIERSLYIKWKCVLVRLNIFCRGENIQGFHLKDELSSKHVKVWFWKNTQRASCFLSQRVFTMCCWRHQHGSASRYMWDKCFSSRENSKNAQKYPGCISKMIHLFLSQWAGL